MSKLLSRGDILAAPDRPERDVEMPEWGGTVRLRTLSGREVEEWQTEVLATGPKGKRRTDVRGATAKLLVRCIVGEDGKPLFTEADVTALGEKCCAALQRLLNTALAMNGLDRKADLEELVGN